MEIINKLHDEIFLNKRIKLAAYLKIPDKNYIYLSSFFVTRFGVNKDLFAHISNDEDKWFIYFNTDSNGFKLVGRGSKKALLITNSALVTLFINRTKCSIGCKFHVRPTNNKIEDSQLIEILINKPFE